MINYQQIPMKFNQVDIVKIALIVTILVSSISLNFLLYNRAKQYYIELNDTRLDPVGLGNYPPETNPRNKTNTNSEKCRYISYQ